jgi:hypothetical protein
MDEATSVWSGDMLVQGRGYVRLGVESTLRAGIGYGRNDVRLLAGLDKYKGGAT